MAELVHHQGMVSDMKQVGGSVWSASNDGTISVWKIEGAATEKKAAGRLLRSHSFDLPAEHPLIHPQTLLSRSASQIVAHWSPEGHSSSPTVSLEGKKRPRGGVAQFKKRFLRTTSKRKMS